MFLYSKEGWVTFLTVFNSYEILFDSDLVVVSNEIPPKRFWISNKQQNSTITKRAPKY